MTFEPKILAGALLWTLLSERAYSIPVVGFYGGPVMLGLGLGLGGCGLVNIIVGVLLLKERAF